MSEAVYIVEATRSPRAKGKKGGALSSLRPIELASAMLKSLAKSTSLDTSLVRDVVLGCVTATGEQGANIAKTAALYAGWSHSVSGATINRFCSSGLDAISYAAMQIACGSADITVAGGLECMSRVPMFSDRGPLFSDPLVAEKAGFVHMATSADLLATLHDISREELDAWALRSHERALAARSFQRSLVPIQAGEQLVEEDEIPRSGMTRESLGALPPLGELSPGSQERALAAYPSLSSIDHRHTIASAPSLADGASILLLASEEGLRKLGRPPRARWLASSTASAEPVLMLSGNVKAARECAAHAGLGVSSIDRFEVNESFACVPIHFSRELKVPEDKINVQGGAISLGHPLGATGGCLVSTLIDELHRSQSTTGLASICGAGGVASAIALERC